MTLTWVRARSFMYDVYYGLRNLWAYKALIWRDRDWDQYYLYSMLAFKLKRMGNALIDNNRIVPAKYYGTKALIAAECARRLAEEDSVMDDKWFNARVPADYYQLSSCIDTDDWGLRTAKYHNDKHFKLLFKIAVTRQVNQRQFYKTLLYKLMKSYGDRWWD